MAGFDVFFGDGMVAILQMFGKVKIAVPPLFKFLDHGCLPRAVKRNRHWLPPLL